MESLTNIDTTKETLVALEKVPPCAKRWLKNLLCFSSAKLLGFTELTWEQSQKKIRIDQKLLLEELDRLVKALETEEISSSETKSILSSCKEYIRNEKWKELKEELGKLHKNLIVFDISEFIYLVNKTEVTIERIKNKDIILIIGKTGSGKSTTILYLSGCEMMETKEKVGVNEKTNEYITVSHITASSIEKNPDLKEVRPSYRFISETRHITAVRVKQEDVTRLQKDIILCDTPGFEDIRGVELDVANGVGLVRAVKTCKTVKLLILVDAEGIGAKGQGLRYTIRTLSAFMPKLKSFVDNFSFGFNKYTQDTAETILGDLTRLKNDLTSEEKLDEAFVLLLNEMITQVEKDEHIVLFPLDKKPHLVYKKLLGTSVINRPNEAFQFFLSDKSHDAIIEQVRRHQLSILSGLKRFDYALVAYELHELQELCKILQLPRLETLRDESVKYVVTALKEEFENALKFLGTVMDDGHILEVNEVKILQTYVERLGEAFDTFKDLLNDCQDHKLQLLQHIEMKCGNLMNLIQQDEQRISSEKNKLRLGKLRLMGDLFPQTIQGKYEEFKKYLIGEIKRIRTQTEESIARYDFDTVSQLWSKLQLATFNLKQHLDNQFLTESYDGVSPFFMKQIESNLNLVLDLFNQPEFSNVDQTLQEIGKTLQILQSVKNTVGLKSHLSMDEISKMEECLISKIKSHIECYNSKIIEQFQSAPDNALGQIEQWFMVAKKLSEIPGLPRDVEKIFDRTKDLVLDKARSYATTFSNSIQGLRENAPLDYQTLAKGMQGLKKAAWVDSISSGTYQTLMSEVEEALIIQVIQMKEQINGMSFQWDSQEEMKKATLFFGNLEAMRPLEKTIPELENQRKEIYLHIEKLITGILGMIKTDFNLEKHEVSKFKSDLQVLEKDLEKCSQLIPHLYLSKNDYERIEDLEASIKEMSRQLEEEKRGLQLRLNKFDEEIRTLEDIYSRFNEIKKEQQGKTSNILAIFSTDPATKFLQSKNYLNVNELIKELGNKSSAKEKFQKTQQDILLEKQEKLKELETLKTTYQNLLSEESSKESQDFLKERGFQSVKDLEKKIKEKKTLLAENRTQDVQYLFTKLDTMRVANSITYLDWALNLPLVNLKKELSSTKQVVEIYVKRYCEFLEGRVQYHFSIIFQDGQSEKIFQECPLLSNRLKEIKEMKAIPEITRIYDFKDILENFDKKLDEYAFELYMKMKTSSASYDVGSLDKQLTIAKALSQLDSFSSFTSTGHTFIKMYCEFYGELLSGTNQIEKQTMQAITQHNYHEVATLLGILENSAIPTTHASFERLKRTLKNELLRIIDDTNISMLGEDIKDDWFNLAKSIRSSLDIIKNAETYVPQYLDNTISQSRKEIEKELSTRIVSIMDIIRVLLRGSHFYEASRKYQIMNGITNILHRYLSQEALNKVKNFTTDLKKALKDQEEKYSKMEIDKYPSTPPKDLYKRFEPIMNQNIDVSETWERIEKSILDKFRNELRMIKETNRTPDFRAASIRKFEFALKTLPEHLQFVLSAELEDIKLSINFKSQIDSASQKEDFDKIQALWNQVRTLKNSLERQLNEEGQPTPPSSDKYAVLTKANFGEWLDSLGFSRSHESLWDKLVPTGASLTKAEIRKKDKTLLFLAVENKMYIAQALLDWSSDGATPAVTSQSQQELVTFLVIYLLNKVMK